MQVSLYTASIPVLSRHLEALATILDKTIAYCAARKIDPAIILQDRLFPDMFPFVRQVQSVTDHAKGAAARLAGVEVPAYPDTEATLEQLKERVEKTLKFVGSVDKEAVAGASERIIVLKFGANERKMTGAAYFLGSALPNFYFHYTTAYAILRHRGLEVGKRDFLGPPLEI